LHPDAAPTLFPTHTIDAGRPPKRKEPEPDDPAEDAQADKGDGTLLYWRSEGNRPAKRPARPTDKQPTEVCGHVRDVRQTCSRCCRAGTHAHAM
jgi:hypothetical protein